MEWIVPCDDFEAYDALGVGEALICSRSGDWALLLSIDGHAIAGARDREFIDALERELSVTSEESAENLLDYWRDLVPDFNVQWIPGLLRHVLGEPAASDLLARNADWLGIPREDT